MWEHVCEWMSAQEVHCIKAPLSGGCNISTLFLLQVKQQFGPCSLLLPGCGHSGKKTLFTSGWPKQAHMVLKCFPPSSSCLRRHLSKTFLFCRGEKTQPNFKSQGLNQHKICGPKGTSTWFLTWGNRFHGLAVVAISVSTSFSEHIAVLLAC